MIGLSPVVRALESEELAVTFRNSRARGGQRKEKVGWLKLESNEVGDVDRTLRRRIPPDKRLSHAQLFDEVESADPHGEKHLVPLGGRDVLVCLLGGHYDN